MPSECEKGLMAEPIEKKPPHQIGAKRMAIAMFSNTCPENDAKRQSTEKSFRNKGGLLVFFPLWPSVRGCRNSLLGIRECPIPRREGSVCRKG